MPRLEDVRSGDNVVVNTYGAIGAVGNGIADDTSAIQTALNMAAANVRAQQGVPQAGAVVQLEPKLYRITSTLVVPDVVALRGDRIRGTVLFADENWDIATDGENMVELGPTNHVTSAQLEYIELNGNQVGDGVTASTGLRGWYSDSISEHGHVVGVRTIDCFRGAGLTEWTGSGGSTGAPDHFRVAECDDILTANPGTGRAAWSFSAVASGGHATVRLDSLTHHSVVGASWANAYGVFCNYVRPVASAMHLESSVIGCWVQNAGGADIRSVTGAKQASYTGGQTFYAVAFHSSMTGKAIALAQIMKESGAQDVDHALFYNGTNYTADIDVWSPSLLASGTRLDAAEATLETIWVPAGDLVPTLGSPALAAVAGYHPGLRFDAAANEAAGTSLLIPADWTTFDIDIVWAPVAAGAGNVAWGINHDQGNAGDAVNGNNVAPATVLDGSIGSLLIRVVAAATGVTRAKTFCNLAVYRFATAASDTYASDAALLGLRLTKAS